jgi:hypothetical protein
MSTPPTGYSYVRFSSKKQEEGDSIRRQIEGTAAWAKRAGVHLDTSLKPDRGSAARTGTSAPCRNSSAWWKAAGSCPGAFW